jgi:anti-anti-sigma factor
MDAVLDKGEIALVRVNGRGNFSNSLPLKKFAGSVIDRSREQKFIVDLHECETMDSTFMGVLAGICINQKGKGNSEVILVNVNDHCNRLLKNLGLTHMLQIRKGPATEAQDVVFKPAETGNPSRIEQICTTLEAHKDLVKADEQNEVRFQAVIEYLKKSLEEESGGDCSS